MKRLLPLAVCLLAGCTLHPQMTSHDGSCTPQQLEHLSTMAADRLAASYPAGQSVLFIAQEKDSSFAGRLEQKLRDKGYAVSATPGASDVQISYQTDTLEKGPAYCRIINSDGQAFSLTSPAKE